jgi:hypothetical protein
MEATEKARDEYIFRYFNGEKEVCGDPSQIYDDLIDDPEYDFLGEWSEVDLIKDLKEKKDAFNKLIAHACKSFNVTLLGEDGSGLTRAEIAELVGSFINWINDVKKKLAVLQTPSETLESSTQGGDLTVETPDSSLSSTEKELSAADQNQ